MIGRRILLGAAGAALGGRVLARDAVVLAVSSNSLAYGGLRIAEAAGLYERNGIALRAITMDSGNAAISAVLAGSAQFAASGPGEALAAKLRGRSIVIVCNVYRGLPGSMVLAKAVAARTGVAADAPIAQRLRALDGLTIAQPSPTSAYLHPYRAAAEAVGARIKFVYMTQPAMVAALQAGAVSGFVAGAPFSLAPQSTGTGVLWISGPKEELPEAVRPASSACLQTTAEYAAANPGVIAAMRTAAADLAALITDRPGEARALLARAYSSLSPADVEAAFVENAANWARPVLTVDDIRREIAIQVSSGVLPGIGSIDPASVLLPQAPPA